MTKYIKISSNYKLVIFGFGIIFQVVRSGEFKKYIGGKSIYAPIYGFDMPNASDTSFSFTRPTCTPSLVIIGSKF